MRKRRGCASAPCIQPSSFRRKNAGAPVRANLGLRAGARQSGGWAVDDRRFDELARALARRSRRGLLFSSAAAGLGLATRLAAAQGVDITASGCKKNGANCSKDNNCCSKRCKGGV